MQPLITRVTETQEAGDQGKLIASIRLEFNVGDLGPFNVTLSKKDFTATAANAKISEFVTHLKQLQGLT